MPRLLRTSVALAASYAIALQLLLLGFALASHAGFDELAVICSGGGAGAHYSGLDNGSRPQHGEECACCPLACAATVPGVLPATTEIFSILLADGQQRFPSQSELGPAQTRHQPQEARGPPLG